MVPLDIQRFSEGRTKARAYFCYLFSKNIPNRLSSITREMIMPRFLQINSELENCVQVISTFFVYEISVSKFKIKDIFEATIIEEEILGRYKEHNISGPNKTMVRFLGSIIIALSIEVLMLVFKFAIYTKFIKLKIDE